MDLDDAPKHPADPLAALETQDLDRLSRDELTERMDRLAHEIERARRMRDAKAGSMSEAENLFKKPG